MSNVKNKSGTCLARLNRLGFAVLMLAAMLAGPASAQVIQTLAGGGIGDGQQAANVAVTPSLLARDVAGNIYVFDVERLLVRRISTSGIITTVAGNGSSQVSGDGGPAVQAGISYLSDMAVDPSGRLHLLEADTGVLRRIGADGIITTIAGDGTQNYGGENVPATQVGLKSPAGLAFDAFGNVYISETNAHRVRKVSANGLISTFAGGPAAGYSGDNGPAIEAGLLLPTGLAVDAAGNLYIADKFNNRIRKVDANGIITTIAGTGDAASTGNGGPALSAALQFPDRIALDAAGRVFIADKDGHAVRQIGTDGLITRVAGTGEAGFGGDAGPAGSALLNGPEGLLVDATGRLLIADRGNNRIRRLGNTQLIETIAGDGSRSFIGEGISAQLAGLSNPMAVVSDGAGGWLIADAGNGLVRRVASNGIITRFAGQVGATQPGDGGPAVNALLIFPTGLARDTAGNVYIADSGAHVIRKVDVQGVITTIAGTGTAASTGDGGQAASAALNAPNAIRVDAQGNLYVAELSGNRIRRINTAGIISTFAGTGSFSYSGDGGLATNATIALPLDLALDAAGNLYIADMANIRIRKVALNGVITTVAGIGIQGFAGDGGLATAARLNQPSGVAVDENGVLYIADRGNHRIRRVETNGTITTVVGRGVDLSDGDGGAAVDAGIGMPNRVHAESGRLFVSEHRGRKVREVLLPQPASVPAAPAILGVTAGNGQLTVFFSPGSDGGSPILDYTVTCGPMSQTGPGSPIVVSGLSNGVSYTCSVVARNGLGSSIASATSLPQTPVAPTHQLNVARSGSGSGLVTSSPAGIQCGEVCAQAFPNGITVTLTATAAQGSAFVGWSGVSCSGGNSSGTCSFTLSTSVTVTAAFDSTAVTPADFNQDGRSDLLWRNGADGSVQGWLMNGLSATQVAGLLPAGGYTVTHVADLDGNGKADTLIRHTDGTTIGWLHDGLNVVGQTTFFTPGSGWSIKHTMDLNGDGKADLIVEHTDGRVVGWLMNGLTVTGTATFVPAGTGWSVAKVGDLNGDGKADLIWQNSNGTVQAWLMDGLSATQTATFVGAGTGWSVKLVADFNGDGKSDLMWQNADGTVQAWLMDGTTISQIASFVPAGTGWSPVLAGDIDGDGKADLFWEHTDGRSQTWLMNGLSVTNLAGFVGAGGWRATHLLDLNGDGKKDVLWKHDTGTVQAWLMNGLTITQVASLAGAGAFEVIPPRP